MTNFDLQLKEAIKTYSELDGRTFKEIATICLNDMEGQTAKNVMMIMFFAAR
mgnify:CR=1 FL=1